MLWVSEILMKEHELASFEDLKSAIQARAKAGEIHFGVDVKPPFPDTPTNWEEELEIAFSSAR
ncbi:MAG: hypothetical protein ACWA44_14290 [Thiotrichales bacterium]